MTASPHRQTSIIFLFLVGCAASPAAAPREVGAGEAPRAAPPAAAVTEHAEEGRVVLSVDLGAATAGDTTYASINISLEADAAEGPVGVHVSSERDIDGCAPQLRITHGDRELLPVREPTTSAAHETISDAEGNEDGIYVAAVHAEIDRQAFRRLSDPGDVRIEACDVVAVLTPDQRARVVALARRL